MAVTEILAHLTQTNVSWIVGLIIASLIYVYRTSRKLKTNPEDLPYPKGPKGVPLLGNALQLPAANQWHQFSEWAKEFGPITGLRVLGKNIVIINSFDAAAELLNKRGAIYSSRPDLPLIRDYGGWDFMLPIVPYGDAFLTQRRMLHQFFNPSATRNYHGILTKHARSLAHDLLTQTQKFQSLNRMYVGATVMLLAYGYEVKGENDEWINNVENAVRSTVVLGTLGAHPIDIFPILGKLPYVLFGTRFAKNMANLKQAAYDVCLSPYYIVKEKALKGETKPSILTRLMEENTLPDGDIKDERFISAVTAIIYIGGADTTVAAIDSFAIAMMLHPDIQRQIQKELDTLLGGERLPTLQDRDSLPLLSATVKETIRWKPPIPLGIPHSSTEDDIYQGSFIPRNTMVIFNAWGMCHNPQEYPDPSVFNPSRFLKEIEDKVSLRDDVCDPEEIIFGFGRRICPGQDFALATVWITAATLLSVYDICLPLDETGQEILPDLNYVTATVSHPKPFQCRLVPRSQRMTAKLGEAMSALADEQIIF
ncbi:cytochrome P450 [Sistotremastrum niveocremeum HHB9708]|uniref:Cytochrome P450 n=1 Tax=Sistotremastrum niveocremeum HHB9708 TaxID=1314777 RepID=A0A164PTD4_9AGAM|nr:cytochrome P450 [Sistotremastrum niveocremeum HHB9708]